jgi:predicted nucleic acid-binding protein
LKKTTAFWDASALVRLCVHEAASRHAQSYLRRFALLFWSRWSLGQCSRKHARFGEIRERRV